MARDAHGPSRSIDRSSTFTSRTQLHLSVTQPTPIVIRIAGLKHPLAYWSMRDDLPTSESPVMMYFSTVRGMLLDGWLVAADLMMERPMTGRAMTGARAFSIRMKQPADGPWLAQLPVGGGKEWVVSVRQTCGWINR